SADRGLGSESVVRRPHETARKRGSGVAQACRRRGSRRAGDGALRGRSAVAGSGHSAAVSGMARTGTAGDSLAEDDREGTTRANLGGRAGGTNPVVAVVRHDDPATARSERTAARPAVDGA